MSKLYSQTHTPVVPMVTAKCLPVQIFKTADTKAAKLQLQVQAEHKVDKQLLLQLSSFKETYVLFPSALT